MIYFSLIGLSLMLLGGFLVLVALEQRHGFRIAGTGRAWLDRKVARASFVAAHVDWGAFLRYLASTAVERVLHDAAHGILRLVRMTERMLTRAVKRLRERRGILVPLEDAQEGKANPVSARLERIRAALYRARDAARREPRKRVTKG